MSAVSYSMRQLETAVGVSARTLRKWIQQGLLSRPRKLGRGARYDERQKTRALAVRALRARGVHPKELSYQLARLSEEQLAALLAEPVVVRGNRAQPPPAAPQSTLSPQPTVPPQSTAGLPAIPVEVICLAGGLWLMVQKDVSPRTSALVEQICRLSAAQPPELFS